MIMMFVVTFRNWIVVQYLSCNNVVLIYFTMTNKWTTPKCRSIRLSLSFGVFGK